jgi:hypothetical protein
MRIKATRIGLLAVIFALSIGTVAPASAAKSTASRHAEMQAQIIVHPRLSYPGPNAKRYCRSWLAKEYRVSGTVIVPRMQCWWR